MPAHLIRRPVSSCRSLRPEGLYVLASTSCCWAQPDPPLRAMNPARAENIAAGDAANFRPLNPISILSMRLTLPFLSRWRIERLFETLRACKQMTRMNTPISAGVEFSPATPSVSNSQAPPSVP